MLNMKVECTFFITIGVLKNPKRQKRDFKQWYLICDMIEIKEREGEKLDSRLAVWHNFGLCCVCTIVCSANV